MKPRDTRPAIVNDNEDEGLPPIEYEVECITDEDYEEMEE